MTEQAYQDRSRTIEDLILDRLTRLEHRQVEFYGKLQREILLAIFVITAFVFVATMAVLARSS